LSTVIDVGGIKVSAVNDGEVHLPPMYYPGLDFDAHPELLQADGTYHIPVGCFLIQAEDLTVLVDAGLGPSRQRGHADQADRLRREARVLMSVTGGD
jgi:hypothetical protein